MKGDKLKCKEKDRPVIICASDGVTMVQRVEVTRLSTFNVLWKYLVHIMGKYYKQG